MERPKPAAEIPESMPTDDDIDLLRDSYGTAPEDSSEPCEWSSGVVWEELHHEIRYSFATD